MGPARRCYWLLLLLAAALLAAAPAAYAQEGERDSGSADREGEDTNGPEETLRDDEDFTGKVPVTFFATSSLSCSAWKDADRQSSSRTIINKMILYISGVCDCDFDSSYLSPLSSDCDSNAGTLLVSTNLTLPYNHQRSQLVGYLENWIKTEPSFTKTLSRGERTTVSVVDLETTNSAYFPTPTGSGDVQPDETPRDRETPKVVGNHDDTKVVESGSGSGSSGEDDVLGSSSHPVAMDTGTIFLSCAAALLTRLMNYS